MKKILVIVLAAVLAAFIALLLLPRPGGPAMPEPNGYLTVVEAGKGLSELDREHRKLDDAALEKLMNRDAAALAQVRVGLSQESHVPWPAGTNEQTLAMTRSADYTALKRIGRAFLVEAEVASRQGQWSNAVAAIHDTLKLSHVSSRGGPVIDALIGIGLEALADGQAELMLPQLPAAESRQLAAAFENFDRSRQSSSEVMDNEVRWARAIHGYKADFLRLVTRSMLKRSEVAFEQRLMAATSRTRILMVSAAARAFEQDKGRPADSVAALIPDYLRAVPVDPHTQAPLKLR